MVQIIGTRGFVFIDYIFHRYGFGSMVQHNHVIPVDHLHVMPFPQNKWDVRRSFSFDPVDIIVIVCGEAACNGFAIRRADIYQCSGTKSTLRVLYANR